MNGHTPPPWRIDDDGAIRTRDGRDVVTAFDHRVVMSDDDARLIAAAPDLLAALTTMMWCVDAGYTVIKNGTVYDAQTQLAVEAIRAAIAKAKGGAA